jgi:hypothetical protein
MNNEYLRVLIAEINPKLTGTGQEALYVICGVVVLAVALFIFVVLYRKKSRRGTHRSHHHHHGNEAEGQPLGAGTNVENGAVRKRRRSRRSKYPERPLNPTLAQTRGLPPLRNQSTPPAGP